MANIDFAALLCSRLCHDLVSPVGAINNGLEILQEEQDASMKEAVLDLIDKSTKQTSNKLQFFRLAFGAAGGFSSRLDMREGEKAIRAFLDGSRVELEWDCGVSSASKDFIKLVLNLTLIASETLIRGGSLHVKVTEDRSRFTVALRGEGQRIIMQDTVEQALRGTLEETDVDPRAAPAFLAHSVAMGAGGSIAVTEIGETEIRIEASIDFGNETSEE